MFMQSISNTFRPGTTTLKLRATTFTTVYQPTAHPSSIVSRWNRQRTNLCARRHYSPRRLRIVTNRYPISSLSIRYPGMSSDQETTEAEFRNRAQQSPLARQRAKAAGQGGGFAKWFPLGGREAFGQWWANVPAAVAEHNVLSFVPYLKLPPTQTETGRTVEKETANGTVKSESTTDLPKTPTDTAHTAASEDPYGPRSWSSNLVKLSGRNRALNEFSVQREGETPEHDLVVVHGYGAGLGFFYKNFEPLSRPKGWRLYALDLLGMGRSSRPPFRIQAKDKEAAVREAEDWFVDSLEEWRRKRGIERFTLLGHSLGGYMAVAYALKYPGHLNKLILASPVGIPEDPYAVASETPDPATVEAAHGSDTNDETSGSGRSTPQPKRAGDNNNFMNQSKKRAANAEADAAAEANGDTAGSGAKAPPRRRPLSKWITYLWDANISPFSLVRWGGPLGPRFVSGWTTRRFSQFPEAEAQALHTYAYTLFRQKGSGEYALAYVLAPGAFARSPLIRRIAAVGRQVVPSTDAPIVPSEPTCWPFASSATAELERVESAKENSEHVPSVSGVREQGVPVVLFYGSNDWMDVAGGYAAADKINAATKEALEGKSKEEKERDQGKATVHIVKDAGHHVYLDGWEEFNAIMLREMEDVVTRERKRREWEAKAVKN